MRVAIQGTEQSRERARETVWRIEHEDREAIISHRHSEAVRSERLGGAWYVVYVAHVGSVRVHERDFAAAVNVARAMLTGGAL